jgi:hypothetical protein
MTLGACLPEVAHADLPPPCSSHAAAKAGLRSTCKRMAAMSPLEGTASPREPFHYRITWRKLGDTDDDFHHQYSRVLNS